jgi:hypothetical protein
MTVLPVCIIGAGPSGLVSAKVLAQRNVAFDCFELGSAIGGNWRFGNDNGRSAAYASLHIDTSKDRTAFSDFPMPRHWPAYLHHTQALEYLERYAGHFDLTRHITFRHDVRRVVPAADGSWEVTVRGPDTDEEMTRRYRAVIVANGHHWDPNLPEIPGSFAGTVMHSQAYRTPEFTHGKRVVVVGIGNSAADIATEVSWHASEVTISTRRSAHIIPRYLFGRPTDTYTSALFSNLPVRLQRSFYRALLRISRGRQSKSGVPAPDHDLLAAHPTLSQDLLGLVRTGDIHIAPDIARLDGHTVHFADDSSVPADIVIYATGYNIRFPFLADDLVMAKDNEVSLYRHVVAPDLLGLYFVGLIQPLGALMPLAEQQAEWVARLLEGAPLPTRETMEASIAEDRHALEQRYVPTQRHTIQVDYYPYKLLMQRDVVDADRALQRSRTARSPLAP